MPVSPTHLPPSLCWSSLSKWTHSTDSAHPPLTPPPCFPQSPSSLLHCLMMMILCLSCFSFKTKGGVFDRMC
ncbi:hypothetical protein HanIR_Chr05g0226321 [Helianthus annuus]|nr:hypothetical protein HanIR_Chr05g0226321 [Helianthus annuus]